MAKKKTTTKGLVLTGRFAKAGITLYMRNGQVVARVSESMEKRSNTLAQFVQRQKMRHAVALWKMLSYTKKIMFTQRRTAYQNFMALANRLPVVYVLKDLMTQATFLMPDIPVSDGTLPTVRQHLGEVDGVAALLTDFKASEWRYDEKWWLYTAVQTMEGPLPRVRFSVREISMGDFTNVDGCLALVGEEYADEMKGWALVHIIYDRCSPQTIVTRCTLYQQYTTEEALQKAGQSYKGITDTPFPIPR